MLRSFRLCTHCGKTGHTEPNCYAKNNPSNHQSKAIGLTSKHQHSSNLTMTEEDEDAIYDQQLKTHGNQSQPASTEKEKETRKTHKLANTSRSALNLRTWTVKTVFKFIISTITLLRLLTYVSVFFLNGCPPNSTVFNANGLFTADGECLFLSPTPLNLLSPQYVNCTKFNTTSSKSNDYNTSLHNNLSSRTEQMKLESPLGHILSSSSGNAERLGIKRAREMRALCWAFKISSKHCIALDH
ncbi:hypothetical protein PSHT_04369, partial [Puccinia striiformis]